MSSLQKFHRRTFSGGGVIKYPTVPIGSGSDTTGYCLGASGQNNLYISPISTEVTKAWGSYNITRGVTNTTDGIANTNTLYGFGSAAHPAAYYANSLTTGGYNTWYLPALEELLTCWSNRLATPFATANSFGALGGNIYQSSTESNGSQCRGVRNSNGTRVSITKNGAYNVRATRISTV